MSGGIGGTVKASIEVESASAVAQLTALAKKFDSVESAVKAASASMDKQGISAKALERAQAALTQQLTAAERVAKRAADQVAAAEAKAERAAERSVDAMIRANQRKMASDKKRAESAEAARAREEKAEQRRITKQGETAAAKAVRDEARAAKEADGAWIKYAATLYTIHNVASLVGRSLMAVYDAAAEGAKIQAAQQFFENAGKSIESYRQATNGMISDAELMKKANLADSMGIDEATFKKLVVVAEASALKTGQSFDHMFNSIIVGTARSSRLLLDNLGIIVSVEQANEHYAKKVIEVGGAHKATQSEINSFIEAMTEEQKQIAFVEEVARKSQGTLDEYAQLVDKTAQNFASLEAKASNAADAIKIALTSSFSDLLPFLDDVIDRLREMARGLGNQGIMKILGITAAGAAAGAGVGMFGLGLGAVPGAVVGGTVALGSALGAGAAAADRADFDKKNAAVKAAEDRLAEFRTQAGVVEAQIYHAADEAGVSYDAVGLALLDVAKTGNDLVDSLVKARADLIRMSQGLGPDAPPALDPNAPLRNKDSDKYTRDRERAARNQTDFTHQNENTRDSWAEQLGAALEKKVKAEYDLSLSIIDRVEKMKAKANELDEKAEKIRLQAKENEILNAIKTKEELDRANQANMHKLAQVISSVGDVFTGLANALKDGIMGVTNAMISGDGVFGALADAAAGLISALGTSVNNVASKVGRALSGLTLGISEVIAEPLGSLFATAAEGAAAMASAMGRFADTLKPFLDAAEYFKDVIYAVGQMVGDSFAPMIKIVRDTATFFGRLIEQMAPFGRLGAVLSAALTYISAAAKYLFGWLSLLTVGWRPIVDALGAAFIHLAPLAEVLGQKFLELGALINNIYVWAARNIFGQQDYGAYIDVEALKVEFDQRPTEANTDATRENTAALRDFAREFRNLPANFKAEGYIFRSQDGIRSPTSRDFGLNGAGMGTNNQRTRT